MANLTMDSSLFAPLFSDSEVAEQFSDAQFVRAMLEVEAALATVEGRLGVIPTEAATRIVDVAGKLEVDFERLRNGVEKSGVPVIELVRQLREQVGGEAANYVHWGATSQDIVDSARVLQIRAALGNLESRLGSLIQNLVRLADRHRHTLMAGRTHAQQALPITFGFKVAGWLAPLLHHRERLAELRPRVLVVQFGGAVGTLATLGRSGTQVQEALASELGLNLPPIPWHTQRDTMAELAGWLSMLNGSLAKMAQDVILLAQSEVSELSESGDSTRGGSSTMPQKNNPITSELIITAARTNASLLASMHQAQVQEHERGTHGWQMEWLVLPQMFTLTAAALNRTLLLSQNLAVDEVRMAENVAASNGLMLAEAVSYALVKASMSKASANQLVKEACQVVAQEGRHLIEVMKEKTDAPVDWDAIREESAYLGSANTFIDRVLQTAAEKIK
ncbi:MAG TPA: 3-carboxy-cis,cis-muconate cycloisomerase [Anaerolineales bacterium]